MTFNETGFRALYHRFVAFEMNDKLRQDLEWLPGIETADCALCYGYFDMERGITLKVIASGNRDGYKYRFNDPADETSGIIRIGAVEDVPFESVDDGSGVLTDRYSEIIKSLDVYEPGEDVRQTRGMTFLDECRDKYFIDDVLVYLTRDGLQPEGCWTRINGLGDHYFVGELLNEPDQNFGWHLGERIGFFLQQTEDGHTICVSDMNPSKKLTRADLEDGTLLKEAIHTFEEDRTQENFIEILELLRDSFVWIPCTAVLSERDEEMIRNMIDDPEHPESIVGKQFSTSDDVRLVPDILKNGDEYFFPVFSSREEMGEYGNEFSKVQHHFLDAIKLARNSEYDVRGIVVNAFTENFIYEKEIFDFVENMKSRLTGEDS